MHYKAPKGTYDIYPHAKTPTSNITHWKLIENALEKITSLHGYEEIRTPHFEETQLFLRSSGETSDIVAKEMYTFTDKGNRSLTLRPEGTAAIVRSLQQNSILESKGEHKYFYSGAFFRYDRPQAGRYRQFHQCGVEIFNDFSPESDVEVIATFCSLLDELEIKDTILKINSLGSQNSREQYIDALKMYLKDKKEDLSEDSKARLEKNPLRILDSKNVNDQYIIKDAPIITSFLTEDEKTHFERVQELLTSIGIHFEVTPTLVRGLDYYSDTVFEIHSPHLGAQSSLGGGGRYNNLLPLMGCKPVGATGFAAGIERLILAKNQSILNPARSGCYIIPLDEVSKDTAFILTNTLRKNGIPAIFQTKITKIKKSLEKAALKNTQFSIIIGEDEISSRTVVVRDMSTTKSETVSIASCLEFLKRKCIAL